MYTLYILQCKDNSLYTGITNNLENRLIKHQTGKGSKYVRTRLPFKLVYKEDHPSKSHALKNEIQIKRLTRQAKLNLIMRFNQTPDK
jgi:putative endonuclease